MAASVLRRRDAGKDKIAFVDIGSPNYDPRQNAGVSYEQVVLQALVVCRNTGRQHMPQMLGMQAMGNIHAILPDDKVVTNVEVFKRLYEQVGLGWVYSFANIGPLKAAAEK